MPILRILLTFGFRKSYRRAADWLRRNAWDSLFLNLPVESEHYINAYAEEKVDEDEFWKDYTLLTGFAAPFINSLKLRFQPILEFIRDVYNGNREVHCYKDLKSQIEDKEISEKIVLLEFRDKVTGKLDLKEWRRTLAKELKTSEDSWHRSTDRILEETGEKHKNIILYGGYLESAKKYLSTPTNKIEIVSLGDYWKSPLDALRTLLWRHGLDNTTDKMMTHYLQLQKRYLDLIIKLKDVDEAHEVWTKMVQRRAEIPFPEDSIHET